MNARQKILLTGATGYVGGRLLRALENRGLNLRCLSANQKCFAGVSRQRPKLLLRLPGFGLLQQAMSGIETAYYLVHSMGSAGSFEDQDRRSAAHFAQAADQAGVRRIIYLGGLGEGSLSPHLRSRQEVGELLRSSGVEVIEFRASIVIGSGSLSFEIIRALVERLPVMVCPRWVSRRRSQSASKI
jgi:uncharacterized protein YbjT (DUF2867 family)